MLPTRLGVAWTPAEAAAALSPRADAELLANVVRLLRIPEVEPGRWDAADLLGVHDALRPWLPMPERRSCCVRAEAAMLECMGLTDLDLAPA
jgi:hypothetical protein